jgi:hypothetical protein
MKRISKSVRLLATALIVALIIGGIAAEPATAQTRRDMRDGVNDFINWCISEGGTPDSSGGTLSDGEEFISAKCLLPGGSVMDCVWASWLNDRECTLHGQYDPNDGTAPPLTRGGGRRGTMTGGTLQSDDGGSTATHSGTGTRRKVAPMIQVAPTPASDELW